MGLIMKDCKYTEFRGSSVGRMMKDFNDTVLRGSTLGRMMKNCNYTVFKQRGADYKESLLSRV